MSNEIEKYLVQFQDIYNSHIYVNDNVLNHISNYIPSNDFFEIESLGDSNSDIVFLEEFLLLNKSSFNVIINKSVYLFKNILKAVNLKYNDIQVIRIKKYVDSNIDDLVKSSFEKKINLNKKKLIISLGSSFLEKNKNIKQLRNNKYNYDKLDLVYTYHPKDLIENEDLKKYVWDDFKFIRDKYL